MGNVKHIFLYQLSILIYSPLNVSYFDCICWFYWLYYLFIPYVHMPVHAPWCACAVRGQLWEVSFLHSNLHMFWALNSGHQAKVAAYCSQKSRIVYLLDITYLGLMYLTYIRYFDTYHFPLSLVSYIVRCLLSVCAVITVRCGNCPIIEMSPPNTF